MSWLRAASFFLFLSVFVWIYKGWVSRCIDWKFSIMTRWVLWNFSAIWDIIVDPRASKFCSKIFKSLEAPQTPRVIQNWTKMDFRNHKKRNKIFFDRKELLFNSAHAHAFTWKIWTQNCVSQAFRRSKSFHLWKLFFAKFFFSRVIGTIPLLQFSNQNYFVNKTF